MWKLYHDLKKRDIKYLFYKINCNIIKNISLYELESPLYTRYGEPYHKIKISIKGISNKKFLIAETIEYII